MMEDLVHVGDDCLGPKELQTRAWSTKIGGVYQGDTYFERSDRANPVKPGTRCYTIGNTFKGPKTDYGALQRWEDGWRWGHGVPSIEMSTT